MSINCKIDLIVRVSVVSYLESIFKHKNKNMKETTNHDNGNEKNHEKKNNTAKKKTNNNMSISCSLYCKYAEAPTY